MRLIDAPVDVAQKIDRRNILATAELVGNPCAAAPSVVQVKHCGDGVHAQAVGMILVEPEHGVAQQEIVNFPAAIVEDERAPVGMLSLARVGMLVEMRSVEISQTCFVLRK